MELKPGYKQTEVGVIPEDWDVSNLQHLTIKSHPIAYGVLKPGPFVPNGIPLLQIQDVIHGAIKIDRLHRIGTQLDGQYSRTRLAEGDLVVSLVGTVGKVASIPAALAGANLHRNLARIRISPRQSAGFVFHYLRSEQIEKSIKLATFGSTQALFNLFDLRGLLIAVPCVAEQEAITEALSDAGALIESLAQLLDKKRQLKRGVLQDLLTGKKRLPGFSGAWENNPLGRLASLYQPHTISQAAFSEDGYPVYGANGIIGRYHSYNHDTWQITVSCRGNCGTVNKTEERSWITGNAMVVNCDRNHEIDKLFLYYLLNNQDFSILLTGSGQPQIVRGPLSEFEVNLPADVHEQTAIAAILSDMDAEMPHWRRSSPKPTS